MLLKIVLDALRNILMRKPINYMPRSFMYWNVELSKFGKKDGKEQ